MCNDFNTPRAISSIIQFIRASEKANLGGFLNPLLHENVRQYLKAVFQETFGMNVSTSVSYTIDRNSERLLEALQDARLALRTAGLTGQPSLLQHSDRIRKILQDTFGQTIRVQQTDNCINPNRIVVFPDDRISG